MQRLILTAAWIFLVINSYAQNVGIGAPGGNPTDKLHVDSGYLRIGTAVWSSAANNRFIKFGDTSVAYGGFVRLGEAGEDDRMELYAKNFIFKPSNPISYTGNVGIGTSAAPIAKLEVNGNIRITDGTQGVAKVLTSDIGGTASWQNMTPSINSGFKVVKSSIQNFPITGSTDVVTFPVEAWDDGGNFSLDQYTAPAAGLYHFNVKLMWSLTTAGVTSRYALIVELCINGSEYTRSQYFIEATTIGNLTTDLSSEIKLTAGQTISVKAYQGSTSTAQTISTIFTEFSGFRVY